MKETVINYLKNCIGWRTKRKLVIISVDDYGNVRLDSKKARENLNKAGIKIYSRFDAFDTLETTEDLDALFTVLSSVKDSRGNSAVFTPYTLPCNIDFEKVEQSGYKEYHFETLPETFSKLENRDSSAYYKTWNIWQEGIEKKLLFPQFHGREHLNLNLFNLKLREKDKSLLAVLKHRCLTSISNTEIPNVGWTAAFSFNLHKETESFPEILRTGTDVFEKIFGYRSESFTPPAQQFPYDLEESLHTYGIKNFDKPFFGKRHIGGGEYKREFNFVGKKKNLNIIVRNVVFEPSDNKIDHVNKALRQIEAAFTMHRPANISSHRVNFCGHVDEKNRSKGLKELKILLHEIVKKWPDVEFISAGELGEIINTN